MQYKYIFFLSVLTVFLSFQANHAYAQRVGINTDNPSTNLHVMGNSVRFQNGSSQVNWTILGFENSMISSSLFKINAPTLRLSANSFSLNPGNVTIGGTYTAQQQLDVNGAIKIGSATSGSPGSIRYFNNKFQGYVGSSWRDLNQDLSFDINTGLGVIYSTNDHDSELYDFVIGDKELPNSDITKNLMFFDLSKAAFRAGELENSSAWKEGNIGDRSFAIGLNNLAAGEGSFVTGEYNEAFGDLGTVFGNWNKANTFYSFVTGRWNEAHSPYETVIGRYNEDYTPSSTIGWSSTDRLFVIGNGTGVNNRNNLLTVKKSGDTRLDGDFFVGADENIPSVSIYEKESGGQKYGEILLTNEFSERSDKRSILMNTNGSNNEPFLEMRRKDGSIGIILDVDVAGDARITTDELSIQGGSDFAEFFDIEGSTFTPRPGHLVSIDPDHPGQLNITQQKEDRKLVGIISGANGVETGMTMGQEGTLANGDYPVALTGRVYVYANEEGGQIMPGDFLTSSSEKGYAMKADITGPKWGCIIGKAMTSIDENGFVLVLVNLQ